MQLLVLAGILAHQLEMRIDVRPGNLLLSGR
jgi:hypothetical protein